MWLYVFLFKLKVVFNRFHLHGRLHNQLLSIGKLNFSPLGQCSFQPKSIKYPYHPFRVLLSLRLLLSWSDVVPYLIECALSKGLPHDASNKLSRLSPVPCEVSPIIENVSPQTGKVTILVGMNQPSHYILIHAQRPLWLILNILPFFVAFVGLSPVTFELGLNFNLLTVYVDILGAHFIHDKHHFLLCRWLLPSTQSLFEYQSVHVLLHTTDDRVSLDHIDHVLSPRTERPSHGAIDHLDCILLQCFGALSRIYLLDFLLWILGAVQVICQITVHLFQAVYLIYECAGIGA